MNFYFKKAIQTKQHKIYEMIPKIKSNIEF